MWNRLLVDNELLVIGGDEDEEWPNISADGCIGRRYWVEAGEE